MNDGEGWMRKKYFYIANWKAYFPYQEAVQWCRKHAVDLKDLADKEMLIICPDFLTIAEIKESIAPVFIGAQNCSDQEVGAFTGEISVESLQDIGIGYCIIGHSERRRLFGETSEIIARKMILLLCRGIIPIVCLDDAWEDEISPILDIFSFMKASENTRSGWLEKHANSFISSNIVGAISQSKSVLSHPSEYSIFIAYEPISAIGTGNVASREEIEQTLNNIHERLSKHALGIAIKMLYGGSVNGENCAELKKIPLLDGFLIGKASTDFQELQNIVYS